MIEIKCKRDIETLKEHKDIPMELIDHLCEELNTLKSWCDEDNQDTIDTFNADNYGYGYIAILEGNETEEEIKNIGLSDGLEGVIPEDAMSHIFEGDKWTRIIVIYNDSYSMSFWIKNSSLFDSYEHESTENEDNSGCSASPILDVF